MLQSGSRLWGRPGKATSGNAPAALPFRERTQCRTQRKCAHAVPPCRAQNQHATNAFAAGRLLSRAQLGFQPEVAAVDQRNALPVRRGLTQSLSAQVAQRLVGVARSHELVKEGQRIAGLVRSHLQHSKTSSLWRLAALSRAFP